MAEKKSEQGDVNFFQTLRWLSSSFRELCYKVSSISCFFFGKRVGVKHDAMRWGRRRSWKRKKSLERNEKFKTLLRCSVKWFQIQSTLNFGSLHLNFNNFSLHQTPQMICTRGALSTRDFLGIRYFYFIEILLTKKEFHTHWSEIQSSTKWNLNTSNWKLMFAIYLCLKINNV